MLNDRIRGLLMLQTIAVLLTLTSWFVVLALVLQLLGFSLLLEQINFVLYSLGIAVALLFSQTLHPRETPRGRSRDQWVDAFRHTYRHAMAILIVLLGLIWATKDAIISRQFVAIYVVSAWFLLLMLNRYLFAWLGGLFFRGRNNIRTVMIGNARPSDKLQRWIEHQRSLGVDVVGQVVPDLLRAQAIVGLPIMGDVAHLDEILAAANAGQVVLVERDAAWLDHAMRSLRRQGCRLLIFNPWEDYFEQPLTVVNQGEFAFFTLGKEPLQNPINRLLKRVMDLAIALPVVLLVLPPLSLFVWLMLCIQSPRGPLFYRQVRSGHGGSHFRIFKYRTLHAGDGDAASRRFAFGSFLRRTSIDELPQFINVLLGQMSVVGPRPHMLSDDVLFARYSELYRDRRFVKPGITGLAQQYGYRGEIKKPADLEGRVRHDLDYVRNWSPWLDVVIILRSAFQVIRPPQTAR